MTQELMTPAPFDVQPIDYSYTLEQIEQAAADAKLLTVADAKDKAGAERCRKERTKLRTMRTTIESKRKDMKAAALEYGRKVDGAAKALVAPLESAEAHLLEQEDIVLKEEQRLIAEAKERHQKMVEERQRLLLYEGVLVTEAQAGRMTAEEFDIMLADCREATRRKAEQEAADKAERDRIAEQQRLENERITKAKCGIARKEQLLQYAFVTDHTAEQLADFTPAEWEALFEQAREQRAAQQRKAADEAERQRHETRRERLRKIGTITAGLPDDDALQCRLLEDAGLPRELLKLDSLTDGEFNEALLRLETKVGEYGLQQMAAAEQPAATTAANHDGMYRRYNVTKSDGTTSPDAVYFVLRLDRMGDDEVWTSLCRDAVRRMANQMRELNHLPALASDMLALCEQIEQQP